MIAYVLPTRNRADHLARTLRALGELPRHAAEVIVVDNAGVPPASAPLELPNGLPVSLMLRARNEGAAARNAGVRIADPSSRWIVMLDDDSYPVDAGLLGVLEEQPADVGAVMADIRLAKRDERGAVMENVAWNDLKREHGGLPEVFIGCGVAIRREAWEAATLNGKPGYDHRFGYYVEEYDLSARLMRAGYRVVMDDRFRVLHEKTSNGRNMDLILRRLVRNNSWVMQRYAPSAVRRSEVWRQIRRYGAIAVKERAEIGYVSGLMELAWTISSQPRMEMDAGTGGLWERFTGKAACREALTAAWMASRFGTAAVVAPGKNEHVIRETLAEMGVRVVSELAEAERLVIGTLSPGPAMDAFGGLRDDPRALLPLGQSQSTAKHRIGRSAA